MNDLEAGPALIIADTRDARLAQEGASPAWRRQAPSIKKLGYRSPADMVEHYPQFFWGRVERYIADALRYLDMTMEGRQWTAMLYSHIFAIEHNRRRMGPQQGRGIAEVRNAARA